MELHEAVFYCIDRKYGERKYNLVLPEGAYRFTMPGCSKVLVESRLKRESLFEEIENLAKAGLHFGVFHLLDHTTCRYYGDNDGEHTHMQNLHRAAQLLKKHRLFKHVDIRLGLHDMNQGIIVPVPARLTMLELTATH